MAEVELKKNLSTPTRSNTTRAGKQGTVSARNQNITQQNLDSYLSIQESYFFVFSLSGSFIFASPLSASLLGYTEKNIKTLDLFSLYPSNQKSFVDDIITSLSGSKPISFELPLVRKDGRYVSARSTAVKGIWNGEEALLFSAVDTTVQKRLEVELSMLSHALRNVSESLSVFDLSGNIIFVNDSFIKTYGYPKEELIGQSINKFHPSQNPRQIFKPIIEKTLKGSWEGEITAVRKNREKFSIYIRTSPVLGDDGAPIVIVGVARDITEKKLLEDQLRQSQKMEAIGQLAGGIAHDFNNLLTVIEGYTELLFSNISENDASYSFVRQIKKAADRATSLTSQLLAFSRRQILQPKTIDVNMLVSEMSVMLKRLIGEDIELTTMLSPDIGAIKADRGQMEQVLMNLAVNARDAMPDGGLLTIETKTVSLEAALYERHHSGIRKGNYVMLAISDNGIGMDNETKERVFEPFFTTKEKSKGTGLGLATVYGIVKQSGGHLWVYSEPGQGTTFKIYLPMVKNKKTKIDKPETAAEDIHGTETILVVEDEFMVRELVCDTLRTSGYTVLEAANGKQAIEVFSSNKDKIDMVLTDVIMPEMSGRKMIETLYEAYPNITALYMSGYTDDAIIKHGVLEPGMAYIQKPFSPKALIQKVRQVLEDKFE